MSISYSGFGFSGLFVCLFVLGVNHWTSRKIPLCFRNIVHLIARLHIQFLILLFLRISP